MHIKMTKISNMYANAYFTGPPLAWITAHIPHPYAASQQLFLPRAALIIDGVEPLGKAISSTSQCGS